MPRCATPACDVLVGLAGRRLRVWNPRSHTEHQREQKTCCVLPKPRRGWGPQEAVDHIAVVYVHSRNLPP